MPKKKGGRICAVIEIGSDMVTMQIAQNRSTGIDVLDRLECFFDLEKETATTGRIGQASILELCRILNGYRQEMEAYGVEAYRLFSTDFLRSAENFIFFESQLSARTGMTLEIISDEEEKALLYWQMQKAMASFDRDKGDKRYLRVMNRWALLCRVSNGSACVRICRLQFLMFCRCGKSWRVIPSWFRRS